MADGLSRTRIRTSRPRAPAGAIRLRLDFAPGGGSSEEPVVVELTGNRVDSIGGEPHSAALERLDPPRATLRTPEGDLRLLVTPVPDARRTAAGVQRVEVVVDGWRFELDVESEARARLRERATSARSDAAKGGPSELRAIIPGRVISVDVAEGDSVESGGRLLILEAMKMQNELRASRAGTVARVAVGPGQTVEVGDVLVVLE